MKYEITRSSEVGKADHGWLHAKHYFSFANYYNPNKMGYGKLRVINDDVIEPGRGFGTHPHSDMEIITIPLSGAVRHEDSAGNKGVITKGEVQVMSAGRGILHSEHNHSKDEALKLFQIWIETKTKGVAPRYGQEKFDFHQRQNQWTQLVSPIDLQEEEGLKIHQDAWISATVLEEGKSIDYKLHQQGSGIFILLAEGELAISGEILKTRDAMTIEDANLVEIKANKISEFFVIEVPLTNA